MAYTLRDYQVECKDSVRVAYKQRTKHIVAELATGTGKAIIAAIIAQMVYDKNQRVLILANRNVLISQMRDKLVKACNIHSKLNQADQRATLMGGKDIVVSSVQTMVGKELLRWPKDYFKMVISDEWHYSVGKEFRNILEHFDSAYHLGLTATAERHDGQSLGWDIVYDLPLSTRTHFCKKTADTLTTIGAIERGWLVPYERVELAVPITIDDLVAKKMISEQDESFALKSYLPRIAKEAAEQVKNSKSLLFFPECKSSEAFAEMLRDLGINARHVDSTYMPASQTSELLDWFAKEKTATLCNAQLLSTGYDQPDIDTVGIFRLMRSTPFYRQMIGRGTRTVCNIDNYTTPEDRRAAIAASEKPKLRILDLMLQHDDHDLCSVACLVANLKSEQKEINKALRTRGKDADDGILKAIAEDVRLTELDKQERLQKLAEQAANAAERKRNRSEVYIYDILKMGFSGEVATPKQLAFARSLGAKIDGAQLSKFQASKIIARCLAHKERQRV